MRESESESEVLKLEESESEVLCTDSTTLILNKIIHARCRFALSGSIW
jgi:hypothetical protein